MMNEKKKKLPRGIHLLGTGVYRLYTTRNGGRYQPQVTWTLLKTLGVPVPANCRLQHPGLELAKLALIKLQSKIVDEVRTGVIAATAKTKIGDLFVLIKQDYRQQGLKSWDHVQGRWDNHVEPFFANIVANELSSDGINNYIDLRDDEGAGAATINRELCIVRRMYKLAQRTNPPKVRSVPYFPKLAEPKARQGFLSDETYDKLAQVCLAIGLWLRSMLAVGCNFGWRKSEILDLQVCQLDFPNRVIRLDPGETKNNEGRTVKMSNEVYQLLSACAARKGPNDYVFTRDGDNARIRDFRTAWADACERAGCPALLFHDLRRTAARNLRRLGVSESVVMRIAGWKTADVFRRYDIVDETDLADAAQRLDDKRERERIEREQVASAEAATATKTATETGAQGAEPTLQ
jgi:integrase